MALRFGVSDCRCRVVYANKFFLHARSYQSGPLPPVSDVASSTRSSSFRVPPAIRIVLETAGYSSAAALIFWLDLGGIRSMYAKWMGEKKKLEMLEELDRIKYESDAAHVEIVERKLDALKRELLTGKLNSLSKYAIFERKKEAFQETIHAWDPLLVEEKAEPKSRLDQVD